MRIELENLEGGKGDFAHVYQPDELNPVDERIRLTEPASRERQSQAFRAMRSLSTDISTLARKSSVIAVCNR